MQKIRIFEMFHLECKKYGYLRCFTLNAKNKSDQIGGISMINRLEQELQKEIEAKRKAMEPYNRRIKNLKTAINNLKQFNRTADDMNEKRPYIATKIEEI